MLALKRLGCVGVLVTVSGCSDGPALSVGDRVDGGTVVQVYGDDCKVVVVSHDSEWQCSAEQLESVTQGGYDGYYGAPSSAGQAPPPAATVELVATDCEGLAARRRPAVKALQQSGLEQSRRQLLAEKCVGRTSYRYYSGGKEVSYCSDGLSAGIPGVSLGGSASYSPTPDAGPDPDGATDYSSTNTQVVGVDEADFVKNDAGYVYVLSAAGLHVIDAWPAPETKQVKLLPLPGEPRRLFLAGDKLVVYARLSAGQSQPPSSQGCRYGYDCRFTAEPGQTVQIVLDVSEPSAPKELRRFAFSGGYVDSRRVGPHVYTVVQDGDSVALPGVDLTLHASSPEALEDEYAARRLSADAAVDAAPAPLFLPWAHALDTAGNVAEELEACDQALAAEAAQGQSFISLLGLDLETLKPPSRTLIAGKPGYVYASGSALYMATDGVDGTDTIYRQDGEHDQSTIHKFALDGGSTEYRGSAAIAGHVLNQFSMDEHDGVLRVATSSGWVPNPGVSSNLITLAEQGGKLQRLGGLGGIAPTEDIRSVRFDGTRAFVVTFKKTDPLFAFDLTDPKTPKVLGELKIPGFSTYMHPLDRDHLLAIGFDADDHGSFAYFDGIQLQIFDVSDLSSPQLLHKHVIGTRGSASEALTNHLAFNYFPSKGLLAVPMTVCENGDDGQYGDVMSFSGLMVFDVSLQAGITEHGRMPFVEPSAVNGSCSSWWTQSTSNVKRSIFMDDYAIGISDAEYQVAALSDLSDVLQKVELR